MATYNLRFVTNEFADHASVLGVQPVSFGFPAGFYQPAPAYRPPAAGQSPMSRALGESRRKMKIRRRLRAGCYSVFNGKVLLD
jgi:hypothetical protein